MSNRRVFAVRECQTVYVLRGLLDAPRLGRPSAPLLSVEERPRGGNDEEEGSSSIAWSKYDVHMYSAVLIPR